MRVGDLVTYAFQGANGQIRDIGFVVEIGKYTGNADVKVKWSWHPEFLTQKSAHLEVVSEAR